MYAVHTAFDDDLGPLIGGQGEGFVGIDNVERLEQGRDGAGSFGPAVGGKQRSHELHCREGHNRHHSHTYGEAPQWGGCGRGNVALSAYPLACARNEPPPESVVEEGKTCSNGKQARHEIEADGHQCQVVQNQNAACGHADTARHKHQEGDHELAGEQYRSQPYTEGGGGTVGVPAEQRGYGLANEWDLEGADAVKKDVMEPHEPRDKDQPEYEKAKEPQDRSGRGIAPGESGIQPPGREENRQETDLEQQGIPLKFEQFFADGEEGQMHEPQGGDQQAGGYAQEQQARAYNPRAAQEVQECVAAVQPE